MRKEILKLAALLLLVGVLIASLFVPFETNNREIQIVKIKVVAGFDSWSGTGFFIDDDLIMTAGHVVEDANSIKICYKDGKEIDGITWYKEENGVDVGLIRVVTPERERKIGFINARVGDEIETTGNPFGFFPVTVFGKVSGINIHNAFFGPKLLLMADIALNPGNSGSPLIHENKVCAMCIGGVGGANNVTFCVPAKILQLVIDRYLATQALGRAE